MSAGVSACLPHGSMGCNPRGYLTHAFADRVFALLPGSEEYDAECERGVCPWPANDDDDPEFLPVRLCIFA